MWMAWGTICLAALLFIIIRPEAWTAWIEKENNFWVSRGRFSSGSAEKVKRLEKGPMMKILLGANVLLSAAVIYMLLHLGAQPHFRAAPPPPAPVPRRQPGH